MISFFPIERYQVSGVVFPFSFFNRLVSLVMCNFFHIKAIFDSSFLFIRIRSVKINPNPIDEKIRLSIPVIDSGNRF
jgi:hypothetical protein